MTRQRETGIEIARTLGVGRDQIGQQSERQRRDPDAGILPCLPDAEVAPVGS